MAADELRKAIERKKEEMKELQQQIKEATVAGKSLSFSAG